MRAPQPGGSGRRHEEEARSQEHVCRPEGEAAKRGGAAEDGDDRHKHAPEPVLKVAAPKGAVGSK